MNILFLRPYKLTREDVRCTWRPRKWPGYGVRGERIGQEMHWCSCRLHEKWGQIRSHRFPVDTGNNEKRHATQEIELQRLDDIVDHLHVASTEVRQRVKGDFSLNIEVPLFLDQGGTELYISDMKKTKTQCCEKKNVITSFRMIWFGLLWGEPSNAPVDFMRDMISGLLTLFQSNKRENC